MPDRNRNARLACPDVGTLDLPWWPDVSRSGYVQRWEEIERPGKDPLLVQAGGNLDTYVLSYVARGANLTTSMATHLGLLNRIAKASKPVKLWLGATNRGEYHVTEVDIAEIHHTADGSVTVADVSITLKRASSVTVNVGPVKPARHPKP